VVRIRTDRSAEHGTVGNALSEGAAREHTCFHESPTGRCGASSLANQVRPPRQREESKIWTEQPHHTISALDQQQALPDFDANLSRTQ